MRLGLVTIGQAPRTDLIPDVADLLDGVDWVEHGALDLLDPGDIAELAPGPGEPVLVSRLRDGSSARLSRRRIGPLLDAAIERAASAGASRVVVLCTGRIDHGEGSVPVQHAEELAHTAMSTIIGAGTLGVLCPLPAQVADVAQRWGRRLERPVRVAAVDPYTATLDDVRQAATELVVQGADQVFLDCIGYTTAQANAAREAGAPAHTARALAVQAALA